MENTGKVKINGRTFQESVLNEMNSVFYKNAEAGDVIIFSGDTFHGSENTISESRRYSLVFEVEMFDSSSLKLDDYGNHPFFIIGKPKITHSLILVVKSFISLFWIWRILKKNRLWAGIVKKIFSKIKNNKI